MLNYLVAIIFGLVQAVTEFLPISSSGHLIILHHFINLPIKQQLAFDVALHLATFLATLYFFRRQIIKLAQAWLKSLIGQKDELSKFSWLIILATLPAATAGYFFENLIENFLRSVLITVLMLILGGLLLIIIEKIAVQRDHLEQINWRKALFIGSAQALALLPGLSRSGITIIAGLASGLKRQAAVEFSFLISLPIILAATIKKAPTLVGTKLVFNELMIIFLAFVSALVASYFTIKYFLIFVKNRSLIAFAIYRFLLAGGILILLI